ncbi:hypothetical protein FB561_1684 [Kribbella amoyensis]|uniref:Uncharacterized protein n=1 Tax=Kribbella amoyensis TaxID=996641 RepID=A0A561BP08_9ACTN|nr:hypothetical protein [Kribbella amoyensis]TWD80601.1 hypothetical protein FB561_1684 [Kribbella amoyensis]
MKLSDRAFRLTAQAALLVTLLGLSAFLLLRTYLGDDERVFEEGAVTEVVSKGPVTIDNVTWKLDSMQPYTTLVDKDKKAIKLDNQVAGTTVVVVTSELTVLEARRYNDGGFTCDAMLRDDRGNVWKSQSVFRDFPLPTYCSDNDNPIKRNEPTKIAHVFVVPSSAVQHLTGIQVESTEVGDFRRVLFTF